MAEGPAGNTKTKACLGEGLGGILHARVSQTLVDLIAGQMAGHGGGWETHL